jgi:hypothetical protein
MVTRSSGQKGSILINAAIFLSAIVLLLFVTSILTRGFRPDIHPERASESDVLVGPIIQIEVRNGCGEDGIAAEATTYLRQYGFDVVESGNHSSFDIETSMVIDRRGDIESAKRVARALGLEESRVEQDVQPDLYLDASVILGSDYSTLRPFRNR